MKTKFNPTLDLQLNLTLAVPVEQVWKAWTTPELICEWFCPKPWKVVECELDFQPGGIFRTVMKSPEGDLFPNLGCFLEVVPNKKLTWTSALLPGFRPASKPETPVGFDFTATIEMEAAGLETKYRAFCYHGKEADKKAHEAMGFEQGWAICAKQLEELMKK